MLSVLQALCEGNPPVVSLQKGPEKPDFDAYYVASLNKLFNKQSLFRPKYVNSLSISFG